MTLLTLLDLHLSLFDLVCTPTASSDPDDPILTMLDLYLTLMTLHVLHVKRTISPSLTPMTLHYLVSITLSDPHSPLFDPYES